MADIKLLSPFILHWEGGYVNDPKDHGGATNMGVTLKTWQGCGYDKNHDGHIDAEDIKLLTHEDFLFVLAKYWNTWKADELENQSVANLLVDWLYLSGAWAIKIPQRILGLKQDGIVGSETISKINSQDQGTLFSVLFLARAKFINDIVTRDPSQQKFYKGWMMRLNQLKFSK